MTFYVIGSEADALGNASEDYDNVNGFDSNYSRAALKVIWPDFRGVTVPTPFGSGTAAGFWVHLRYVWGGTVGNISNHDHNWLKVISDTGWVDLLLHTVNGTIYAYKYQRDSTNQVNRTIGTATSQSTVFIDIHVYQSGVDSVTDIYFNSTQVCRLTRASETSNGISSLLVSCSDWNSKTAYASEIIIADTDTRGLRVKTVPMTGNSATNTAWAGDYTDIDEYNIDGNAISASALDQVETFTHAGVGASLQTGGIAAVSVNGLISGNGVNDVQACIRKASTNYFSTDIGVNEALKPYSTIWTADPATSGSFGRSDITGLEFGFKSVT